VGLLTPTKLQVGDLKKEWHEGTPIYEYFKVNSTHLQGFEDIDKMDKEEIAAYEKYEKLKKRLEKAPQDEWDQLEAELQDATDSLKDILGRSDLVVTIANHIQYVHTFKHQSLKRLIKAGAVAALGIVAFAWAANPPPESSSVSLRGADLHGADLSGVNLRGADLTGAVLRDVDFTGTDLRGANLTGADVSGVTWSGTLCPDGVNSDDSAGSCENHLEPRESAS